MEKQDSAGLLSQDLAGLAAAGLADLREDKKQRLRDFA